MSGPVWRFEARTEAGCSVCFRTVMGVFVEGEVADNDLHVDRRICRDCYRRLNRMLVTGEVGRATPGPAYAHR